MPKSRQKPDAKSSHEKQEEVTVVDKAVVEASSEPRGQSDGSGEKALLKFAGKISSRLFSRPDWLPLGLRGSGGCRWRHIKNVWEKKWWDGGFVIK